MQKPAGKAEFFLGFIGRAPFNIESSLAGVEVIKNLTKGKEYWSARFITVGDVSYKYLIQSAITARNESPSNYLHRILR